MRIPLKYLPTFTAYMFFHIQVSLFEVSSELAFLTEHPLAIIAFKHSNINQDYIADMNKGGG